MTKRGRKPNWTEDDPRVRRHIETRKSIDDKMQDEANRDFGGSFSLLIRTVFSKRYGLDSKK